MQLAIDTSTATASLALFHDGVVLTEMTWHSERNHTVELLPNLAYLLGQAKTELRSIDGISVARGPGSFNGLRVGMSTAKGLALALSVPLVGIGSLEVEAFPYAETALPICPIFHAGRGEIATARYQQQNGEWRQLVEEHISTVDVLCSQATSKTLFCGEITPAIKSQLRGQLGPLVLIPLVPSLRRAGFLAELGWQRLGRGDFDDPVTLQPLYLRRPPITQPRHK